MWSRRKCQRWRNHRARRLQAESHRTAEIRRIHADQTRGMNSNISSASKQPKRHKKVTVQDLLPIRSLLLLNRFKRNYSARKVKRLKSTTFNSGSTSFNTSLTVFLPSMMSSWFSKQTSFKNLPRRPLAIF